MPLLWEHIPAERVRAKSSLFSRTLIRKAKVKRWQLSPDLMRPVATATRKINRTLASLRFPTSPPHQPKRKTTQHHLIPKYKIEPWQNRNSQKRGIFVSSWLSPKITKSNRSVTNVLVMNTWKLPEASGWSNFYVAYRFQGFYYMIAWDPKGNTQSFSTIIPLKFVFHWSWFLISLSF